ncbi:protein sidekick-2-like, partial [Pecten maximus]|uniref:protein sidekick-2-like n=1 Tax=Pecten maximus TaxID=6579 RepID=UPI001458E5E8
MSLPPETIVVSQVQSQQFTLNWTKPTITNGNLKGYRLTVLEGSTCVREVIFTCPPCTGFTSDTFISCQETDKQSSVIMLAYLESYTYTAENLNPYINYSVSVLAVNAAGDGHPNTTYVLTDQEVPQSPTSLTASVLSTTEITVTWTINGPEPGPTTYKLYVIPESPESSRTVIIS